jgi:hypothetical protein
VRARRAALALLGAGALIIAGCGSSSSSASSHQAPVANGQTTSASTSPNGSLGPEGIPLQRGPSLAPASSTTHGATVDGVQCAPIEQLAYHIHAHLQVFIDGQPRSLPGGIGMVGPVAEQTNYGPFYAATGCYYWLHTHASDGIIHIESPSLRLYTLGTFFDEWREPLSSTRVAGLSGKVTAFLNGKRWTKTPRDLPLLPHAVIQLDVGSPVVRFVAVSWAGTRL